MALGDKKSSLQPSSTQAQQFRLQFSNLAPGGVAPASLTSQQPAPVANARPAVSAFVSAPAPVSLQAPPTIPPPPPAPAPAPAPVASNPPIVYRSAVGTFLGTDAYMYIATSSNAYADYAFNSTSSYEIAFLGTPADYNSINKKTVFHTYSGSFVSQSVEIYFQNGNLAIEYRNSGSVATIALNLNSTKVQAVLGKQGNGHTFFKIKKNANYAEPANVANHSFSIGKNSFQPTYETAPRNVLRYTFAGNTDFCIGGSTSALHASNPYSGSLQFITFKGPDFMTSRQIIGVCDATLLAKDISPQVATFDFSNPAAFIQEFVGSLASGPSTQINLTGSGYYQPAGTGYY